MKQLIERIFYKPKYVSETTHFINDLKRARPELESEQRSGRALLWDKNVDRGLQADQEAGRVEQKAYPYQTSPTL
jgi:hypothetical protein